MISRTTNIISDLDDPRIKRLHNLQLRKKRDRAGVFFADGYRFVALSLQTKIAPELVVFSPDLLSNQIGWKLLKKMEQKNIPCLHVSGEVYQHLSLAAAPQGLGAVVPQQWKSLEEVQPAQSACWVACETVQSPGNLGTILRTADAVGAQGLIVLSDETDPYDPGAVRATMGSLFALQLVRATPAELMRWKHRHQCQLVGTSPAATLDYRSARYQAPLVLLMGWERQGLTPEQQARCDLMVRIPMVGSADSLNLAVATGVMLYEIFHQGRENIPTGMSTGP